jgi:hypothetical protein
MFRLPFVTFAVLTVALGGAASSSGGGGAQHGPIAISSNSDFTPPGSSTGCACVTAGDGVTSPYVIGPWAISAPNATTGEAVQVDNSGGGITKSFVITGISAGYQGVSFTEPFIQVSHVNGTAISNVSANNDGLGVEVDYSSGVTLDNLNLNKMTGNALFINHSSYVTLSNSKLKATADGQVPHNADGLYALDSDHLSIGGLAACPKSRVCNTFDYDTGWGVYLEKTDTVTIDQASANADDTGGFILDGSSHVDLGNSTAEAEGPICITLNGGKTFTGYHTDMQGGVLLVNGSHDNAIHGLQIVATGVGIGSGGNGFFFDPCQNAPIPFSPAEGAMGDNNTFNNDCFNTSNNIAALPPKDPCP